MAHHAQDSEIARHRRRITAYHAYIQPVLKALKDTHEVSVPYTLRSKVCNQAWREKLGETVNQYPRSTKTTIELQQIAWEDIQNNFDSFIRDLRRRLDQYALVDMRTSVDPKDGLSLADWDYETHMNQIVDRLDKEQPDTPSQSKISLAEGLWKVRKYVRSEEFIEQEEENLKEATVRLELDTVRGIKGIQQQVKKARQDNYKHHTAKQKNKDTTRKLSAYNLFMKHVLQSLKQSHGSVSYGHRFKASARLWTQRMEMTAVDISTKTKTPVGALPKQLIQERTWEGAQRDMGVILIHLAQSVEYSARLEAEAEAGHYMHSNVPRANSEYNRHMQSTLAQLKEIQSDTPYQTRFKLAASMWQERKKERSERRGGKKRDYIPVYSDVDEEDIVLQGPSSSIHPGRIPMGYYDGEFGNDLNLESSMASSMLSTTIPSTTTTPSIPWQYTWVAIPPFPEAEAEGEAAAEENRYNGNEDDTNTLNDYKDYLDEI
ncbi:hypothetical protein E3P96_01257 [Wallemia ichthyophaga]|nr:hypothetical protein E3P96_01257 [Wallemia ichthyophaga]